MCPEIRPKAVLVCYYYSFEVSPTLKNICSFLYDNGWGAAEVYVEDLYREKNISVHGAEIINLGKDKFTSAFCRIRKTLGWPVKRKAVKWLFEKALKKRLKQDYLVFAVDFVALDILNNIGFDLSRVIFLSLESIDYLKHYRKSYVVRLLQDCAMRVVQSKERGDDINKYLNTALDFEYLPVSYRPMSPKPKAVDAGIKLIYSGYFANWACLLEFVSAFKKSCSGDFYSLLLQGHHMETDNYFDKIKAVTVNSSNIKLDESYYDDSSYSELLSNHDIGLAFYKNISGTGNFENMILSSGKIAVYLWNGMAVFTNIKDKMTEEPPFVYFDSIDEEKIKKSIELVNMNRRLFAEAAYALAEKTYNFDVYFGKIVSRALPTANNTSAEKIRILG